MFGVQPAAVDDADASMTSVPAVVNEPTHDAERLGTRHAVQVAPIADDVAALFQFPDLAPIDAICDEVVV